MSADAFAASFAKYASITGDVGEPHDQDVGAGQIRITVPLTLRGELKRGGSFLLRGQVVLHRVNDGIETPDAVDHLWRIESSGLKPRPGDAAAWNPKIGHEPR